MFSYKKFTFINFCSSFPICKSAEHLDELTIKWVRWLLLKTHIDEKILFPSPVTFSLFFSFFCDIYERDFWERLVRQCSFRKVAKDYPQKQQGDLSLEKVTKRWLWSWTVCSPWSLATGYLKAEGMSALQGFLRSRSLNGQRAIGSWGIPARDWVASQHPQGNPLGLRML